VHYIVIIENKFRTGRKIVERLMRSPLENFTCYIETRFCFVKVDVLVFKVIAVVTTRNVYSCKIVCDCNKADVSLPVGIMPREVTVLLNEFFECAVSNFIVDNTVFPWLVKFHHIINVERLRPALSIDEVIHAARIAVEHFLVRTQENGTMKFLYKLKYHVDAAPII